MKFAIACCGTLLVLLSSCAKEEHRSDPRGAESLPEHAALVGSVSSNTRTIQESKWAEDCDKQIREIQEEIAKELDRRQDEILAVKSAPPDPTAKVSYNEVVVGPHAFRELSRVPAPKPGWQIYQRSWKAIIDKYQVIKNSATDLEWRSLNAQVKGILLDDLYRVEYGVNYYRDKDSGPSLLALRALLEECKRVSGCLSLDLSAHESFLQTQPLYTYYLRQLESLTDKDALRDMVERFHKRVEVDAAKYDFSKNPLLIRKDANTFTLPLDANAYNGILPLLQNFIESAWADAVGKSVLVEWRDSALSFDVFRFILHPQAGSRAYVSSVDKTINLFPNESNKVVAHEIGHVIGFRDTYFSVWDDKNCRYTEQYREDDLMSDVSHGLVLPFHWEKLQTEYPLTTR